MGRFTAAPSAPAEEPKRLAVAVQEPCQEDLKAAVTVIKDTPGSPTGLAVAAL